jgi:hypothetical protein
MEVTCRSCGRIFDGSPVSYLDAHAKMSRNEDRNITYYRDKCPRCRNPWGRRILIFFLVLVALQILLVISRSLPLMHVG